jgi:hypothetical protein
MSDYPGCDAIENVLHEYGPCKISRLHCRDRIVFQVRWNCSIWFRKDGRQAWALYGQLSDKYLTEWVEHMAALALHERKRRRDAGGN